ncbi:hypothetical protein TNIN_224811 [Trichonephila inaurata madagascariensis]|uniref:Uncharacterized protein n=1 Tax=Trichonephila inaurata madagascariensis TaxID=2747483 RepID=A0A8X6XEF5_9ARAC|nr:hypothetical protein TNIN_224811 [Trichonephila inaurata madagascariensis]
MKHLIWTSSTRLAGLPPPLLSACEQILQNKAQLKDGILKKYKTACISELKAMPDHLHSPSTDVLPGELQEIEESSTLCNIEEITGSQNATLAPTPKSPLWPLAQQLLLTRVTLKPLSPPVML